MTVTVWGWDVLLGLTALITIAILAIWRRGDLTRVAAQGLVFVVVVLWIGYLLGRWAPCGS